MVVKVCIGIRLGSNATQISFIFKDKHIHKYKYWLIKERCFLLITMNRSEDALKLAWHNTSVVLDEKLKYNSI